MMELRLRSLQSKETHKLEVPNEFSIQNLKEFLSHSLSLSYTIASTLRLSLNGIDALSDDSLLCTGINSGDLVYYEFSSSSTQRGNVSSNLQDSNSCNPIIDMKMKPCEIEDEKLEIEEPIDGEGESIDFYTDSDGKRLSEPYFLERVFCEEMGDDFSDTSSRKGIKLVSLAIHAVMLETGFIGLDSMSGLRVDLFDIMKEQPSTTFTTSVSYTLPKLLSSDNDPESIVLKFQTLGHYVNVYGFLAKGHGSVVHKLKIDTRRYTPDIGSFWVIASVHSDRDSRREGMDLAIAYAGKVIFEFWKLVKDGLALPLLMDLCQKTGLDLPPCFIRLPADLKFRILELLPGQDIARVACVCKEMCYLSSNNELWKEKCISEFGSGIEKRVKAASHISNWKAMFSSAREKPKKRKRGGRSFRTANPFGDPQRLLRLELYPCGIDPRRRAPIRPARLIRRIHSPEG